MTRIQYKCCDSSSFSVNDCFFFIFLLKYCESRSYTRVRVRLVLRPPSFRESDHALSNYWYQYQYSVSVSKKAKSIGIGSIGKLWYRSHPIGNWCKLLWLQTVYILTVVTSIILSLCITSAFICLYIRCHCYDTEYIVLNLLLSDLWKNFTLIKIENLLIQNHDFDVDAMSAKCIFDVDA